MKFTKTHEWIDLKGDVGTVGVTEYAQSQLGDVVYVELPKINSKVKVGDEVAVLESTKAAADVYSPVSGTIIEVNTSLSTKAELVNTSAEKEGWLFKIHVDNVKELDDMMNETDYKSKNNS